MKFSVKAHLQRPDRNGMGRLYIRYVFERKNNSISLEARVHTSKFDTAEGFVKVGHQESSDLNLIIRQATHLIEQIASGLAYPDFKNVKRIYHERMAEYRKQKEEEAKRYLLQRRGEKIEFIENVIDNKEVDARLKELEEEKQQLLQRRRELDKLGFRNESSEEIEFKKHLAEYPDLFRAKSRSSYAHIKVWSKVLLEFSEKTNTQLTWGTFDYRFYEAYAGYLMGTRKYYNNNFGNHVKRLKAFLRYLEEEKELPINRAYKKYKVTKEEKDVVFLTADEVDLLWDYRDSVKPEFVKYIDLCVFGNLTGLRYSDIHRSKWVITNGVLTGLTKKTKGRFQIPLMLDDRIQEILEKYSHNLRLVSSVKYNKYIKVICKELFEKHEINTEPIPLSKYRLDDEEDLSAYKWELIASHTNRRGFCTRLWFEGYSERDILLMLGSRSNEVLRGYIRNGTADLVRTVTAKVGAKKLVAVRAKLVEEAK